MNHERSSIGLVDVDLTGQAQTVRVPLKNSNLRVRVVNKDDVPVANCTVAMTCSGGDSLWSPLRRTSESGRAEFVAPTGVDLLATLGHPDYGRAIGILIPGDTSFSEEVTLTLAPDSHLLVRFADGPQVLAGAKVKVFDSSTGALYYRDLIADSSGVLSHGPLSGGVFKVLITHPGFWPSTHTVEARQTPVLEEVQVRQLGALTIRVRASNGLGVPGAHVDLVSQEFGARVDDWIRQNQLPSSSALVTSSNGDARLDGIPHGPYHWSLENEQGTVIVPAQAVGKLDIVLP
jgi:hypothetical protein